MHALSAQERTFVVGPHGGKLGSIKVDSFTGDAHAYSSGHACRGIPCGPVSAACAALMT